MSQSFNFLPHTDADRQAMLKTIGIQSQAELFSDIPASLRENITYTVMPRLGLSEQELQQALKHWANDNAGAKMACFLGGGAYHRFIPPAINTIAMRSEFYTAYTPYQPEIAQGTLQYTYEFQTMMCELTGQDVANASVYDGASAVTEAALMALRATKRNHVLIADSVNPDYRAVLKTYLDGLGQVQTTEFQVEAAAHTVFKTIDPKTVACVILQQPNYFGSIESVETLQAFCTDNGALLIVSAEPFSLGLLEAPASYGADITVGDIQPLGNNLAFGGPYGGYMATQEKHMRQLPGRLVGKTLDKKGQICYTLTLQTREQHIKRERATSNICTNQALNILKATVFMTLVGPEGLRQLAEISTQRAHHLAERLCALPGVSLLFPDKPFLFEFALQLPVSAQSVLTGLENAGILGGISLSQFYPEYPNTLLVCCTEMTTPEQLDHYVRTLELLLEQQETPLKKSPAKAVKKVEVSC